MSTSLVILNLLGAVSLLLWGLSMVSEGVTRAFGQTLRHWLAMAAGNRLQAVLVGLSVTLALQSSTATCLMTASFVARDLLGGSTAQALMLGANIGTSIVTRLVSFNLAPVAAALALVGVSLFRSGEGGRRRAIARICIGLGIMLLSLQLLESASTPLRNAHETRVLLADLNGAALIGLMAAAGLTVLAHSSIAVILMIVPLAHTGIIGPELGIALVLGANIGSALPPLLETRDLTPAARRIPLGNAGVRILGAVLCMTLLGPITRVLPFLGSVPATQLVNFHIVFNVLMAAIALPFLPLIVACTRRVLPDLPQQNDATKPRYLDESALNTPSVALGCATRETLRIGDLVEEMLQRCVVLLGRNSEQKNAQITQLDLEVYAVHQAVKLYLARLPENRLDVNERRRMSEIMTFAINLEHISDITHRNVQESLARKSEQNLSFSSEGDVDIRDFFRMTLSNLQLALAVFLSEDIKLARQLVSEKVRIRQLEFDATRAHLARLRAGRRESIESSSVHLDLLRDLKRINAHLSSVAYPLLEQQGELNASRLRQWVEPAVVEAKGH